MNKALQDSFLDGLSNDCSAFHSKAFTVSLF